MVGTIFSIIVFISFLLMTITITTANIQDIIYNKTILKKIKLLDKSLVELEKELEKDLENKIKE